jgi:hypothetical protein
MQYNKLVTNIVAIKFINPRITIKTAKTKRKFLAFFDLGRDLFPIYFIVEAIPKANKKNEISIKSAGFVIIFYF